MEEDGLKGSITRNKKLRSSSFGSKPTTPDKQRQLSSGKSFLKVFGRNFSKQLPIPEEFVVNFKGNVPHRFIIENGMTKKCWRVEVEEDEDGKMCFGEGWSDFVKEHSLEAGCFLVFEYEEQSIFQIKIYSKNGCEKLTSRGMESGLLHTPEKTIERKEKEESENDEDEQKIVEKHQRKARRLPPYKHGISKKYGIDRYAKATEVFISKDSVGFSTTLHKRKRHQFDRLAIPKAVAVVKKLLSKKEVTLQVAGGKCWVVDIIHRRQGSISSYFYKGWKKFLNDNKIVGGDRLTFKFITDDLIHVDVQRNSPLEHHSGDEDSGLLNMDCEDDELVTCSIDEKEIETSARGRRSSSESIKSSSFSFSWRETTTGGYLHVPRTVADDQDLKSKERVVLRDPEGKCWPVNVKTWYDGRVGFIKGWRDFWRAHNIAAGDTLHFNFVSESLIQVNIDRAMLSLEPTIEGAQNNPEAKDNAPPTIEGDPISPESLDNGTELSLEDPKDVTLGQQLRAENHTEIWLM